MYSCGMPKNVIHISEKEAAATSVATLPAHLRAGTEVIIENGAGIAVLHPAEPVRRTISACIALLPEDSTATVDPNSAECVAISFFPLPP